MTRILTLALAILAVAAAPAGAAIPRDWLGVAVDGPLIEAADQHAGEWPLIASSGATSVRIAFYWSAGQPLGPGAVDFSVYDAPVLAAAQHGLGVLPVVFSTPPWARIDAADPASPPREPGDYAAFLTALVHRYGPGGSLWAEHPEVRARPIRAWQLWNEPNLRGYWSQQPFAKGYVRLLKAARGALRTADRRALAVLAGLPNGWDALRRIYQAGGRRYFDAVAIHPYTAQGRSRAALRARGAAGDAPLRRPPQAGVGDRDLLAGRQGARQGPDRHRDRRPRAGAAAAPRADRARGGAAAAARAARVLVHVAVRRVERERVRAGRDCGGSMRAR